MLSDGSLRIRNRQRLGPCGKASRYNARMMKEEKDNEDEMKTRQSTYALIVLIGCNMIKTCT
jgi:hypothetical protein